MTSSRSGLIVLLAIGFAFIIYGRIHKTLRITPSMAAGLSDHVWSLKKIVMMADSYMPENQPSWPLQKTGGGVMGIYPSDLPPIMCPICGRQIGFTEQPVAVLDKDGKRVHWQCWFEANRPMQQD